MQEEEKCGGVGALNIIEREEKKYEEDCKIANDQEEDDVKRQKLD